MKSGSQGWVDSDNIHMQIKVWSNKTAPAMLEFKIELKYMCLMAITNLIKIKIWWRSDKHPLLCRIFAQTYEHKIFLTSKEFWIPDFTQRQQKNNKLLYFLIVS